MFLLGNKSDLETRKVSTEEGERAAREHGFAGFFETSAKLNVGVTEACEAMAQRIVQNSKEVAAKRRAEDGRTSSGSTGAPRASDRVALKQRESEEGGCCS